MNIDKATIFRDEGDAQNHPAMKEAREILVRELEELVSLARSGQILGIIGTAIISTSNSEIMASKEVFVTMGPPRTLIALTANFMRVGSGLGMAMIQSVGGMEMEEFPPETSGRAQ